MRIRILKHSAGVFERVSLSQFLPGLTYEVPVSLGAWLIAQQAAEEDVTDTIAIPIQPTAPSVLGRTVPDKTSEDDRPPRRPKKQP